MFVTVFAVLLAPFTNCGQYGEPMLSDESESVLTCTTDDCIQPQPNHLKIQANLTGNLFVVKAGLAEFNIGGDCNEGGYPSNTIHWDLYLNGNRVRHSAMLINGTSTAESICVNGRFLIYVNLAALRTGDPVDRTGLKTGNGTERSAYDLYLEIYGHNLDGKKAAQSSRLRIPLVTN